MIFEKYAEYMGRAVAKDILGTNDLTELDRELDDINDRILNKDFSFILNNKKYSELLFVLSTIKHNVSGHGFVAPAKKITQDYVKKYIHNDNSVYDVPSFFEILKTKDNFFNFFIDLIFVKSFLKNKRKIYNKCILCNNIATNIKSNFALITFNEGNYRYILNAFLCSKCYFYNYLANLYPYISYNKNKLLGYRATLFIGADTTIPYILFFSNYFSRFVKYIYISKHYYGSCYDLRFVLYKPGSQNSNPEIIFNSEFSLVPLLYKMLNKGNLQEVNNFKYLFLENNFVSDKNFISVYLPLLRDFFSLGYISASFVKFFLNIYREKYGSSNIIYFFSNFYKFLKAYYEVIDLENELFKKENVVSYGFRFSRGISKNISDKTELEQARKYLNSLSAQMELSSKQFMKGILEIERKFQVYLPGINNKDKDSKEKIDSKEYIQRVSENDRMRVSFLVGLLSGLYFKEKEGDNNE